MCRRRSISSWAVSDQTATLVMASGQHRFTLLPATDTGETCRGALSKSLRPHLSLLSPLPSPFPLSPSDPRIFHLFCSVSPSSFPFSTRSRNMLNTQCSTRTRDVSKLTYMSLNTGLSLHFSRSYIVNLLIEGGADPHVRDHGEWSAMHWAECNNRTVDHPTYLSSPHTTQLILCHRTCQFVQKSPA